MDQEQTRWLGDWNEIEQRIWDYRCVIDGTYGGDFTKEIKSDWNDWWKRKRKTG